MTRYLPLLKIASGGMATVHVGAKLAEHDFVHLVALKRPHQHLLEDFGFRDALLREANVASKLRHANVVSVRDVDAIGDSIQLVMDYVEGASLGQILVRASKLGVPLPPAAAIAVARDSCAGLESLHALSDADGTPRHFVHRDVSPQNILVGLDGVARITDFGLAKCARASEQPTTQGTLKGKLGYMAPEYVKGEAIDRRADVFAMGVVLWEALAGRRLFRGENDAETLQRVVHAPIPPISAIVPELHPDFDDVLACALERDPARRFPSMIELREAIEGAGTLSLFERQKQSVIAHVERAFGADLEDRRKQIARLLDEATAQPGRRAPKKPRAWAIAGGIAVALVASLALGATVALRTAEDESPKEGVVATAQVAKTEGLVPAPPTTVRPATKTATTAEAAHVAAPQKSTSPKNKSRAHKSRRRAFDSAPAMKPGLEPPPNPYDK
jgi:serine/threonine-protein kinase